MRHFKIFRFVVVPGCGEERVLIRQHDGVADGDSGSDEANEEHAKEAHTGECLPRRSDRYADAGV